MICSIENCDQNTHCRGWCKKHYMKWYSYGDPLFVPKRKVYPKICTLEGCEKNLRARGYCAMHWRRWRIHGDPSLGGRPIYDPICSIEGCETNSHTRGYCKIHYERIKMNGTIETKVESHGMWQTVTYRSYQAMKNRCKSGKKKWYKNVKVCSRWKESFKAFYDDMGERPKNKTLDRIDNDGNYSCGKCEECLKNNWSFKYHNYLIFLIFNS